MWGGFAGDGQFFLKLWTDRPKMKMEEWAQDIGKVKRTAEQSGAWSWELGAKSLELALELGAHSCEFPL